VHSVDELLEETKKYDPDDVYIIGGASVYEQMLPYCDTAIVTKIDHEYEADAYFHDLDNDPSWKLTDEGEEQTYFNLEYNFLRYRRVKA
jgi:dihydrofolate reductase